MYMFVWDLDLDLDLCSSPVWSLFFFFFERFGGDAWCNISRNHC